jgi:hypothetical protein
MRCQTNRKQLRCNYKESVNKIPGSQTLMELFTTDMVGKAPSVWKTTSSREKYHIKSQKLFEKHIFHSFNQSVGAQ